MEESAHIGHRSSIRLPGVAASIDSYMSSMMDVSSIVSSMDGRSAAVGSMPMDWKNAAPPSPFPSVQYPGGMHMVM